MNPVKFNILKTPSIWERIITLVIFLLLFANGLWLIVETVDLIPKIPTYISAKVLGIIYFFLLFKVERFHDSFVRGRIIGYGTISPEGLEILGKKYNFSDINMLWINYGMNTIGGKYDGYLFEHFETIKLRLINNNNERFNFHIDNYPNELKGEALSTYLKNLKKKHLSFKIHFHDQKRFSKKEYELILKRHSIMKRSFKNRKLRRSR